MGGGGGVDNVFWGEGVAGEMNRGKGVEKNCWSLKGITLALSMSSTQRDYQEVICSLCLSVY